MLSGWHDDQIKEGDGMEPTVGIAEAMVATAAALAPASVASREHRLARASFWSRDARLTVDMFDLVLSLGKKKEADR
jgi:biopolymer transport protein ExbB/TolQ